MRDSVTYDLSPSLPSEGETEKEMPFISDS